MRAWIKGLILKRPEVQQIAAERDSYMRLYKEQLQICTDLESQRIALQSAIDRLDLKLQSKNDLLQELTRSNTELASEIQKRENHIQELNQTNTELNIELSSTNVQIDELNHEISSLREKYSEAEKQLEMLDYKTKTERLDSGEFWDNVYLHGGNSGTGSYNRLAQFKSDVVNLFLEEKDIDTVIELGCGDGNQLSMIRYNQYTGVDVSPTVVKMNNERFSGRTNIKFFCSITERGQYINQTYDMALSMDVIFHLVEDDVFSAYLNDLFFLAKKYVVIYSSNHEEYTRWPEYRHRNFTGYVQEHFPQWELVQYIPNRYPYQIGRESETSASDFFVYQKIES